MKTNQLGIDLKEGEGIRTGVDVLVVKNNTQGQEEVLLGLRKAEAGKKTWGLPGGHQRTGETILKTANRELLEELGKEVKITIGSNVLSVRENRISPWYIPHITVVLKGFYEGGEILLTRTESNSVWKWFELNSLPTNLFSGVGEIVSNYQNDRVAVVTDWHKKTEQNLIK